MIDLLLLSALTLPPQPPLPGAIVGTTLVQEDRTAEFDRRYEAAKESVDLLWELHAWTVTYGLEREGRKVLRQILRLDDGNRQAHEALGHVFYDGQWFDSQEKADAHRQKQEQAEAKAKGWVKYGDSWVDPADIPYLERGWVKNADGRWVDPEEQKKIDEGWVKQDLTWIPPDEIEQLKAGLWKVGDQWLDLAQANEHHSKINQWWQIPGDRFVLWTTCARAQAEQILREVDRTYSDLERFLGRTPPERPVVLVLRNADQYNTFATGDDEGRGTTEALGWSSAHYAFFADLMYDASGTFQGTGVGYWDNSTEAGDRFGRHSVRHAAGLSYVEAVDRSLEFEARVKKSMRTLDRGLEPYYAEKDIPFVLRYGAAAYVERWFIDADVATGGNPHWVRTWSWQNIAQRGGLDPVARILEFRVDVNGEEAASASGKLINEAGLLVAFIMSGTNEAVTNAHRVWREALKAGAPSEAALEGLIQALAENETALRSFGESLAR